MFLKNALAILVVGTATFFVAGQKATAATSQLEFSCKAVQVEFPSGFGAGRWRLSSVVFVYPSMTAAQFAHFAKSKSKVIRCQQHAPTARGYRVGTYHFTSQGPVTGKIRMSGCAPDGQRVYINIPVRLPVSGGIKLGHKDVSVRGRC